MQTRNRQTGFTLVEIAIVLVIIGLLLGGILKGQELITQARIKNVVNDFNGITAAVNSYRDRYRVLPGDDGQATRWGAGTPFGNANGMVEGCYSGAALAPCASASNESTLFWQHLRLSGFVSGDGPQPPTNAASGIVGVQTGAQDGANGLALGAFGGLIICSTSIGDKVAGAVDTQMDDGRPNTGQMRALSGTGNVGVTVAAPSIANNQYGETGGTFTMCHPI